MYIRGLSALCGNAGTSLDYFNNYVTSPRKILSKDDICHEEPKRIWLLLIHMFLVVS